MYQFEDVFPTKVMFNENPILEINRKEMMEDIDKIIADGTYVRTPLYQCKPILFQNHQDHWSPNWENLRNSFKEQVESYLSMAREQYGPPEMYTISNTTAWFYRKDMNCLEDTYGNNPIHNHYPAQVVGVYYLDNPGVEGTTIYNHNQMNYHTSSSRTFIGPTGSWLIFPGWMQHHTSSGAVRNTLPRTVIACNAYLTID
jgi:hypothetical protein